MHWIDVEGTQGAYQINSSGVVRRKDAKKGAPPRWVLCKQSLMKVGYFAVTIKIDGVQKLRTIHRLLACHFIPKPASKEQVNHINGIKTDNRIENLEWVTPAENIAHARRTGLNGGAKGSHFKIAKYGDAEVLSMIRLHNEGMHYKEIHKLYPCISLNRLYQIVTGRAWKHLHLGHQL